MDANALDQSRQAICLLDESRHGRGRVALDSDKPRQAKRIIPREENAKSLDSIQPLASVSNNKERWTRTRTRWTQTSKTNQHSTIGECQQQQGALDANALDSDKRNESTSNHWRAWDEDERASRILDSQDDYLKGKRGRVSFLDLRQQFAFLYY